MKANQHSLWNNDKRAQVGIGTMIVFIATILVAATAAAVLIDTSGKLQERSSTTGNEATKQVASNLLVKTVAGERSSTSVDKIHWLNITVGLAPGASAIDMTQVKIEIANGEEVEIFDYAAVEADDTFQLDFQRDDDSSANTATTGDLIDLQVDLKRTSFDVDPRDEIEITLIPEVGSQADASFVAPESLGANTYFILR